MWPHQFRTDRASKTGQFVPNRQATHFKQSPARQGVAVRVQSTAGDADHRVADLHLASRELPILIDNSNDRSDEVDLIFGVDPWHFGGFSTDQRGSNFN